MKPKGLIELITVIWDGDGWIPKTNKDIFLIQQMLRYAWGKKKFNKIRKMVEDYEC